MTILCVGTVKLKSNFNEYLRRVQAGDTIIITRHGKMIGQIVPVKPTLEKRLKGLVDSGLTEWHEETYQPKGQTTRKRGAKQVSELVSGSRAVDHQA